MGKRSPLGQICGRLVPFSLTTTLCRHTHKHTHTDRSLSYYRFNCSNDSSRIGLLRLYRQFWPAKQRVRSGMEGGKDVEGLLDIRDKHILMRIYVGLRSVKD